MRPTADEGDGVTSTGQTFTMSIGRLHGIVVECLDPQSLAAFYAELLGMILVQDEPDWVVVGDASDRPGVAFQRVPELVPTTWPSGERPQYRHFDVAVADLNEAEEQVLALGARRLGGGGASFRVYADPAGHPLCLVTL